MKTTPKAKPVFQGPFGLVVSHSVLIVLLLGIVSSAFSSWFAHHMIRRDEEQRFEMARQEVEDLVHARFERVLNLLFNTRAFLTTKERVSRQDFRIFLQSVDLTKSFPDLVAVGYADRISNVHRFAHERDVREDGFHGYRIWPRNPKGSYLYPVKYVEPLENNRKALGFDLHSDASRAATMDQARDLGRPLLTPVLTLVADSPTGDNRGFLLILPVYHREMRMRSVQDRRWALRGFIFAPMRASDIFRTLYHSAPIFRKSVGYRVTDAKGAELFSVDAYEGSFRKTSALNVYGQTLNLEIFATDGFASPADRLAPLLVFISGLLITLLVNSIVYLTGRHAESQREAVEMRDEFLSICSHELRTPLTSMKLQNQLVQRSFRGSSVGPDRIERLVQQSGRQIERLERLVEEMLDISRIRSGKLTLTTEELDFAQLVNDVAERFAPQLQDAGCAVTVHAPTALPGRWDRLRLEQVIVNLLSNAMKYGAGKPIEVRLSQMGDHAVLSVRDEGIGIAPEHQSRIFERFERASSKTEISGLGLGLYIVRQILELQGGTISVESRLGFGSCFEVSLPMRPTLSLAPEPALAEAHSELG